MCALEYNKRSGNRDYVVYLNKIKLKYAVFYRLRSKLVLDRWWKNKNKNIKI